MVFTTVNAPENHVPPLVSSGVCNDLINNAYNKGYTLLIPNMESLNSVKIYRESTIRNIYIHPCTLNHVISQQTVVHTCTMYVVRMYIVHLAHTLVVILCRHRGVNNLLRIYYFSHPCDILSLTWLQQMPVSLCAIPKCQFYNFINLDKEKNEHFYFQLQLLFVCQFGHIMTIFISY